MRYSVRKSGRLATLGQRRSTIEDALELAFDHLASAKPGEDVTLEDHTTGVSYKNEDIRRLTSSIKDSEF